MVDRSRDLTGLPPSPRMCRYLPPMSFCLFQGPLGDLPPPGVAHGVRGPVPHAHAPPPPPASARWAPRTFLVRPNLHDPSLEHLLHPHSNLLFVLTSGPQVHTLQQLVHGQMSTLATRDDVLL